MDNLLLKTIEFFFIPEAALSVIFLIVFIAIFLLGIKWRRYCRAVLSQLKENAVRDYGEIQNKLSPQMFLQTRLAVLTDEESRIGELPNVFVSVGILATFLGLGVAIQGAADLLHEDTVDLMKLIDVLGVIAFKFQTSIWGVCFSLIFQRFFVDSYFSQRQDVIDELTAALYAIEGDDTRALLAAQNKMLGTQFSMQQKLQTALAQRVIGELEKQNASLDFLKEHFIRFVDTSVSFTETAREFKDETKKLQDAVVLIQETVDRNIRESQETFQKVKEDFISRLVTNQEEFKEELHSIQSSANRYIAESQKQMLKNEDQFAERTQRAFEGMLESQLGRVHDEYMAETRQIGKTIQTLSVVLEKIDTQIDQMQKLGYSEQKKWTALYKSISDDLKIVSTGIADQVRMGAQESAEARRAVEQSLAAMQESIKTGQESFLDAFISSRSHEDAQAKEIKRLLEEIRQTTDLHKPLQELAEIQQKTSGQQIAAWEKQLLHLEQVIQTRLAEPVSERIGEESTQIQQLVNEHLKTLQNILRSTEEQLLSAHDRIREEQTDTAKQISDLQNSITRTLAAWSDMMKQP